MSEPPTGIAGRQLRILFSLLHPGYLRHYAEPIRLLADRGHAVSIVLSRGEKDPGDWLLVERLQAAAPSVGVELAPERGYASGWRRIAWMIRALLDLSRYTDPRFAHAPALRRRIRRRIDMRVDLSRMDPFSKRWMRRLVDRIATTADIETALLWRERFTRLERAVPTCRRIDRFFRRLRPDAVLASPVVEIASAQVELLKSARRLGIPTGICVASWDNLTNKGLMRVLPDRVLVWNEIQRDEAVEFHGVPRERVVPTGAQRFDKWFEQQPSTPASEFSIRVGLDPDRPYVLYVCSSPFIAGDEVSFVRRWLEALRSSDEPSLDGVGALIRPHPQNASQWRDIDTRPFANAAIWPREGAQPDQGQEWIGFYDSIAHSAAVVGINTSALIEAAIAGRSVHTVLDPDFAETQEGTLHFHYLLHENGGFLHVARDLDEHLAKLARTVGEAAEAEAEQTRRFVASFVRPRGLDVPAAPIVADEIERLATAPAYAREPLSPRILALRGVLFPFAVGATVVAGVAQAARTARSLLRRGRTGLDRRPAAERA